MGSGVHWPAFFYLSILKHEQPLLSEWHTEGFLEAGADRLYLYCLIMMVSWTNPLIWEQQAALTCWYIVFLLNQVACRALWYRSSCCVNVTCFTFSIMLSPLHLTDDVIKFYYSVIPSESKGFPLPEFYDESSMFIQKVERGTQCCPRKLSRLDLSHSSGTFHMTCQQCWGQLTQMTNIDMCAFQQASSCPVVVCVLTPPEGLRAHAGFSE